MKRFLCFSILSLAWLYTLNMNAQNLRAIPASETNVSRNTTHSEREKESSTLEFGYCGEIASHLGAGAGVEFKLAIQIPAETAKKYVGNKLSGVMIGTGLETGKNLQLFLTYDLEEPPFYTQDITLIQGKWSTVTLDTPYNVEDKEFFIGYKLTSGTNTQTCYPIGIDEGPANAYGDWVGFKDKKGNYSWSHLGDQGFTNICIKGVFEGESLPQYDLSMESIKIKGFQKPNAPFDIQCKIKNRAAQTIHTFDVAYQIGENAPVSSPITADVNTGEYYSFSISNVIITEEGSLPIKVSLSNLNGNTDEDESNNMQSKTVLCTTKFVDRKVLLENFTTAGCINCPGGHEILKKALNDNERVIWVAHHAGFGTDNYTIDPSVAYTWFYNENGSTYAPAMMLDRTNLSEYGASGSKGPAKGPVFSLAESVVKATLDARLDEPSFVTVGIDKTYNEETRELSITVSGKTVDGALPGDKVCLNLFLLENGLIGYQSGGGSKYVHDHVIRDVLSETWGDEITFEGDQYQHTYSTTLSSKWKAENMQIVAFIGNYDKTSANNCNVYNAESTDIIDNQDSGINSEESDAIRVYHSEGTVYIEGEYEEAVVFHANGQLVKKAENTDHFDLENGVYLVKVISKGCVSTHKIMICK